MAAIIHPSAHLDLVEVEEPVRPSLVVLEGGSLAALRQRQAPQVYRRRRILAVVALVAIVAALVLGTALAVRALSPAGVDPTPTPAAGSAAVSTGSAAMVVQPGDSLWSIARRVQPEGDVRQLVSELAAANGGSTVLVGQRLIIPAR